MKKSTYIFISILLCIRFWNLAFIINTLNEDIVLVLSWIWIVFGFLYYQNKSHSQVLYSIKYIKLTIFVLLGVLISMFSAQFFWDQSPFQSIITVRQTYNFLFLPAILLVQPSEKEIVKALKWISYGTIFVWIIGAIAPTSLANVSEKAISMRQSMEDTDIGYYVIGIRFVVFYFYFKVQDYIKEFTMKSFFEAFVLLAFIFLYQNRSMLLGVMPVLIFSIFKFKTKYKAGLVFVLVAIITAGVFYSWDMWVALFNQSQRELNSDDYNRWKALFYYIYEHSPNWFCYIFGNGFASEHSSYGAHISKLNDVGIMISDIGLIGMWSSYGVLPLIALYSVLIKVITSKRFPLFVKFASFHILMVPTIFHFWNTPGVIYFVIVFYLFSYYDADIKNSSDKEVVKRDYINFSKPKHFPI